MIQNDTLEISRKSLGDFEYFPINYNDYPQLKRLSLPFNNYKKIPNEVAQFHTLVALNFSNNRVRSIGQSVLVNTTMKHVSLCNNELISLPNMSSMICLDSLDLANNMLTSVTGLNGLSNLKYLDITGNKLESFPKLDLPLLENLSLSDNTLREIVVEFPLLQKLDVSNNLLATITIDLPLITSLNLSGNSITSGTIKAPQLLELNLNRNINANILSSCTTPAIQILELESLNLSHVPNEVTSFLHISKLNLSFNSLKNLPENLTTLSELEALYIKGNDLQLLPECYSSFQVLTSLSLGGNPLMDIKIETATRHISPKVNIYSFKAGIPDEIIPSLFVGGFFNSLNQRFLKAKNVTHILSIGKEFVLPRFPQLFMYKVIDIDDSPDTDIKQYFDECILFIEKVLTLKQSVLVHCAKGVSRSATIVIAYIMQKYKKSYEQAFLMTKKARSCVQPNEGFIRQLKEYEDELALDKTCVIC
ncbi:hypothetical protein QTN25_006786 [Entamoeba marina]